jgi:hypothetical protein
MDMFGSFFSFLVDLIEVVDPFPYLHRLTNSVDPRLGAVAVGIPIVALSFAPVGYWLYRESAQDKKRLRREKARMARHKARAAAENQRAPHGG